jgi:uncharacterized protein YjbJ (UPF0337 family)
MDKDLDQAKGKIKQAVGDLTDDRQLAKEGRNDERAGKVKEGMANVKDRLDDAVDKVKDKLSDDR